MENSILVCSIRRQFNHTKEKIENKHKNNVEAAWNNMKEYRH